MYCVDLQILHSASFLFSLHHEAVLCSTMMKWAKFLYSCFWAACATWMLCKHCLKHWRSETLCTHPNPHANTYTTYTNALCTPLEAINSVGKQPATMTSVSPTHHIAVRYLLHLKTPLCRKRECSAAEYKSIWRVGRMDKDKLLSIWGTLPHIPDHIAFCACLLK